LTTFKKLSNLNFDSDAIGSGRSLKPDRSSRPVRFKPLPGAWRS